MFNNTGDFLSDDEVNVIKILNNYTEKNTFHNTADIWSCLSKPEKKKKIRTKGINVEKSEDENPINFSSIDESELNQKSNHTLTFSQEEIKLLTSIKGKLTRYLKNKNNCRCAYCKRPMGNYGWSWHIEHIQCKQHNRSGTFELNNLTFSCIDCNYNKGNHVDKNNQHNLIINPNEDKFIYSNNIKMKIKGDDLILILNYSVLSDIGKNTYDKLKLSILEYSETLLSMNSNLSHLISDINHIIDKYKHKHQDMADNHDINVYDRFNDLLCELKVSILNYYNH